MTAPNIFSFATSELSQDAFICWLASWGNRTCKPIDPALHALSHSFLRLLLESAQTEGAETTILPREIREVAARRQVQSIDVVIEINNSWILIIEDKTDTGEHSNQLERYKAAAETMWPEHSLACIYLKTGDQSSYANLDQKGWGAIRRHILLALLRDGRESIDNPIFQDFLAHLEQIESDTQAYRHTPITQEGNWGNWTGRAWQGFFLALDEHLKGGDWGYVPNPTGGFMGYWWCFSKIEDSSDGVQLYLQLSGPQLTVKLHVPDRDRRAKLRDHWCGLLRSDANLEAAGLRRPSRLGLGRYMTVSCKTDYRVSNPAGLLDLDATVADLFKIANLKKELLARVGASHSLHHVKRP